MVQVEVARKSDFGKNDRTFIVNTHLGETLNYHDTVLGFDLDMINLNELEELEHKHSIPPVVLVKKTYPRFRNRQKHRLWKLKHLDKEGIDDNNIHGGNKKNDKNKEGKN
jgi:nonsense-mediated mRNA decay protein 3